MVGITSSIGGFFYEFHLGREVTKNIIYEMLAIHQDLPHTWAQIFDKYFGLLNQWHISDFVALCTYFFIAPLPLTDFFGCW